MLLDNFKIKRTIILCTLGTILEWYDFAIFGSMIPILSELFFPNFEKTASFLATFAVFTTGFVARPLGGAFFGYIGDKFGRKITLFSTIIIMAISTSLIGILPTYESIGITSTIFLVLLRILQGLSSSGEHSGAITYLSEVVPTHKKYFMLSFAFIGVVLGMFLGSFVGWITISFSSADFLLSYGWRMPFLSGAALGICGLYLRIKLAESEIFKSILRESKTVKNPVLEVLKKNMKEVILVAGMYSLNVLSFYIIFVYVPADLVRLELLNNSTSLAINSIGIFIISITVPIVGFFSDKIAHQVFLKFSLLGFVFLTYPLFLMLYSGNIYLLAISQCIFGILMGMFFAPLPVIFTNLFPNNKRFSGVAIGMNISAMIIGGTSPIIMVMLTSLPNYIFISSLYIIVISILSYFSSVLIEYKKLSI
ncbi:MAG: MFS transporter [Alphaproteobacteria bacterium]|nr:MFS transporter [Alphaproteobacteria bacterium]